MDDAQIVELFWQRDERAVREAEKACGQLLGRLARNVLGDREDARECVNDALWKAWGSIPPQRPADLTSYLCRIVRQEAIDRWRARNADKRRDGQYAASLDELAEVAGDDDTADTAEARRLGEAIEAYLRTLPGPTRRIFVGRYFYADSLGEAARREGLSVSAAKSLLYRTRQGLKRYLEKEGFTL